MRVTEKCPVFPDNGGLKEQYASICYFVFRPHWKFTLKLVLKNKPRARTSSSTERRGTRLPFWLSAAWHMEDLCWKNDRQDRAIFETLRGKRRKMKTDNTFRLINHKYPFIYPIWGQEQSARKP